MNYATTDERKAEFEDGYLDFLKKVRSLNPDSYIFQTYGVMGTSLEENIENVRRKYMSETGDERITFIPLTMQDWEKRLNSFIEMFDYGILQDAGKVSAEIAKLHAETEFEKYRVIQDSLFMSDFDRYMLELEESAKK